MLETPRISTCSFFAYSIDTNGDLAYLMRKKLNESKQMGMFTDFGTTLKVQDPNIFFSAARSYIAKTAGLCVPSESLNIRMPLEIKRIIKENLNKQSIDIYTNPKVHEVLDLLVNNQPIVFLEVLGDSHLAIFVPLTYFEVEPLNMVLREEMDSTRFKDTSFHWIPLS